MRGKNSSDISPWQLLLSLLALLTMASPAYAGFAEIVSLSGKGQYRAQSESTWSEAKLKQILEAGNFVRTGDTSRMAVLLDDQTQIRLAANSMLQIKQVGDGRDLGTVIYQHAGRSWTQSKNVPNKLSVETPSALAAIQGTDWEMEVDEEGRTRLTVLHGVVELYNAHGSVTVRKNEQALAEKGKAPVKLLLQNPAQRVQWVTSYTIDVSRYAELNDPGADTENARVLREIAGLIRAQNLRQAHDRLHALVQSSPQFSVVAYLLLADFAIYGGDLDKATDILRQGRQRFPDNARFDAQLARVALYRDDADAARLHLSSALSRHPEAAELKLAQGEVARFDGDARLAAYSYLAATELAPKDPRGWHGRGVVESEMENIKYARPYLDRALEMDNESVGTRGELATLETFANNLGAARKHFDLALQAHPDDYIALTGLGLLQLKSGDTEAALETLLKASVIEPKYARAVVYSAIAYYQLGRHGVALETLARAAELDRHDPLPHQFTSMIYSDRMEPGKALAEAREAMRLMPYLKSLHQLANDLQGSANLGASFAQLGMADWALHYALQSYNPFWAGSHFFLADRYSDPFLKNSEFILGFLTDPLAMGASNRQQTLVSKPGHYQSLGWNTDFSRDNHTSTPTLRANGYLNMGLPWAYSLELQQTDIRPQDSPVSASGPFFTGGVGARLSDTLTGFIFGNHLGARIDDSGVKMAQCLSLPGFPAADGNRCRFDATLDRLDTGVAWRPSSSEALWLKLGATREDAAINEVTQQFNGPKTDQATIPRHARDVDLRYAWRLRDNLELTLGAEAARLDDDESRSIAETACDPFSPSDCSPRFMREQDRLRERSRLAYAGVQFDPSTQWRLAALVGESRYRLRADSSADATEGGITYGLRSDGQEITRKATVSLFTLQARPAPGQVLSFATQRWLQPVVPYTLIPLQWGGVSLDTAWLVQGGLQQRELAQWHWESSPSSYSVLTLDRQRISNVSAQYTSSLVQPLSNEARLDRLRATAGNDFLQGSLEGEPRFAEGWLKRAKLAVNGALSEQWSLLARFQLMRSENTILLYSGKALPFAPRRQMSLGTTWTGQQRWQLGALATYRSERYSDQGNQNRLSPGWGLDLRVLQESADRAWRVEAYASDIAKKNTTASVGVRVAYRF